MAGDEIKELLRSMFGDYQPSVGLKPDVTYVSGAPIRPVVPLDVNQGSLFVLGAYPSARFEVMGSVSDVPAADNLGPFEEERWFDGTRVRSQPSADELRTYFLQPLGLQRTQCWITNLVKVFLFKKGHKERYQKLGAVAPVGYERERFEAIATESLPWIERELQLAKPRLMVTLGAEVAGVLRGIESSSRQVDLLKPEVLKLKVGRTEVSCVHCAHPGILMRPSQRNPWPDRHEREFVPVLKEALAD